jgi:hypothetical protein
MKFVHAPRHFHIQCIIIAQHRSGILAGGDIRFFGWLGSSGRLVCHDEATNGDAADCILVEE